MKILVAVEGCEAHRNRFAVIEATWGKSPAGNGQVVIAFLTGPWLNCPDDYASLPFKTKAICRYAGGLGYDYLCKVDTDTYVHVPRLLASGFEKHDYSGFAEHGYSYGPLYWLSKKAFSIIAESDPADLDYEDEFVGRTLAKHGITPYHDPRYSHWFPVLPDNDKIIEHLGSTGGYTDERMREAHRKAYGG